MAKEIKFDQEARAKILAGVDGLANAVKVTRTAWARPLTPAISLARAS